MNAKQFKSLIKECVKEGVREELQLIFGQEQPHQIKENKTFNFKPNVAEIPNTNLNALRKELREKMGSTFGLQTPTITNKQEVELAPIAGENPYLAFIADSAANLTPQERQGLRQLE